MNTDKLYLLTEDYRIVYIDHVCACDKCRERGETEIFIHGLDGSYVDCLKLNELNTDFRECGILTCANSIDEIVKWIKDFVVDKKNNENKLYKELNKLLNKQICEDEQKKQEDSGTLAKQINLLPDDVKEKIKETIMKINQEGAGGLICILSYR